MIVGSGLVASHIKDREGVIFHAAGIADSLCDDDAEFARDAEAVRASMALDGLLVYVSTICAPGRRYSRYKALMEREVLARGNVVVVRLPIIGGRCGNDKTLMNVIANRIRDQQPLEVWMRAWRTVVDVDDAAQALDWYASQGPRSEPVEVGTPWAYAVPDLVDAMERGMRKKARKIKIDTGDVVTAGRCDAPVKWRGIDEIIRRHYA